MNDWLQGILFYVESGEIYVLIYLLVAGLTVERFLVVLALYLSDLNKWEAVCLRVRLLVCVGVVCMCDCVSVRCAYVDVCWCAYALIHKDFLAVFLNSCFYPKLINVKFYKHHFIFNSTAADMDLFFLKQFICICMSLFM